MSPVGPARRWGRAVFVRRRIAEGRYVVAHEVGHLLGAGHDRQQGVGGAFAYSWGSRFIADGVTYCTVMAYEPGIKIPYFSNPNVLFRGVPTGVPADATDSADNARTINQLAPEVASLFRATNRFEFAASNYSVSEGSGPVTLEVLRSGDTNLSATVECTTASGTATAGTDFTAATNTVVFTPGATRQAVTIPILDDALAEGDETFVVSLRNPQPGMALGLQSSASVVILDDEVTFAFTRNSYVAFEAAGTIEVPARRSGNTNAAVTVAYALDEGSAKAGIDFMGSDGTLRFVAGAFTSTGGTNRNYIARLNPDGSLDTTFDASLGPNDFVRTLAVQPNGWLVVGRMFTTVSGQPRNYLARLRSDDARPAFAPPTVRANGEVVLKLFGNAQSTYVLESSGDLARWVPLWTNRFTGASWDGTEPSAATTDHRFYRARQVVP